MVVEETRRDKETTPDAHRYTHLHGLHCVFDGAGRGVEWGLRNKQGKSQESAKGRGGFDGPLI